MKNYSLLKDAYYFKEDYFVSYAVRGPVIDYSTGTRGPSNQYYGFLAGFPPPQNIGSCKQNIPRSKWQDTK